jgi:D-tyrosyl-tRNA(Tyr) deacylase
MRAVVQRVSSASVAVGGAGAPREVARIGRGLLALVGVERDDGPPDAAYIAAKVHDLRVFEDPGDPGRRLNRSVGEVSGAVLVVSQFTLAGDCRTGRRPAFDAAAPSDIARPLYESVVASLRASGLPVSTGEFQGDMQVSLVNDGPVTLLLDSRKRF